MEQTVIHMVKEINENVDFSKEDDLFAKGVLDSFAVAMLVPALEEKFNIEFEAEEIIPENFQSIKAMVDFLNRKKG